MSRTASGRLIIAIFVALLVAFGYTSLALHAKKPPKPDPEPPDPPPVQYQVTWIPGLEHPDDSTEVSDVNALGEFVGSVRALDEPFCRPVYGQVDMSGNLLSVDYLDLLPGLNNAHHAIGINDQGRIVGHCRVDDGEGGQVQRVFAYDSQTGVVQVMNVPDYDESRQDATRLAEDGSVVGSIRVPDVGSLGFIWQPGADPPNVTVLDPEDFGTSVYVTGVNHGGEIVGNFGWGGPMFYSDPPYAQPVDLGETILPVGCDPKQDINDSGTIVGTIFAGGNVFTRHVV